MKKTLIILVLTSLFLTSAAHPIDLEMAQSVATKFMATNDLQLVSTYQTVNNAAALYVFNTTDGFVIVAADDCETPIIGYSHEGCFDPNNVPVQMEDYLQDFVARIQYGIENHIVADETTTRQWELVKTTGRLNDCKANTAVEPLLTEKWHQGCLYNSLCPAMSGPCDHAEVGCVALAMGQIMHYWKYPNTGWGSQSYYNAGNTYSADFGNTLYDWEHMPDSLTETSSQTEIQAVASLLYHCGVSVMMQYGTNGSAANSADVPNALIRYFNYSRRLHREKRSKYSNEDWLSLLKQCLDLQRPVYYSGHGDVGGHAFVCDGYDDNSLLHFNWGWGGSANGYFALGNLNPIGVNFNDDNYAILDINPQYEPWMVEATPYPPTGGTIEGTGGYHIGEQCTLTAVPAENRKLMYWKRGGQIISHGTTVTLSVEDDINDIEACFSFKPVKEIRAYHAPDTNDLFSPYVGLSWGIDDNPNWPLLNQFEINREKYVTTDSEHIYTAYSIWDSDPFTFGKYTMYGELVEFFNVEGARPEGLTCDGSYFYCSKNTSNYDINHLYCFDFTHKTLIDSINMGFQFSLCAYDAYYDGFWIINYHNKNFITLINRQSQIISRVMLPSAMLSVSGFGCITAKDGNLHLLILSERYVYDYDISNSSLNSNPIISLEFTNSYGASIGKYDGKDAMFITVGNSYQSKNISIFEINSHLSPILHYRLYRTDSEGQTVMLADEVTETSYIDSTWTEARSGKYRFGISEVYFNGVESEIMWSDPILKTGYGIDENQSEQEEQPVQKVFENGQIIIIKDGERYNVLGQRLN